MTDPEAPVMKHKDGRKLPSYNYQSATDGKYGLVCAVATRDEVDVSTHLFELVDQARENTKQVHEAVMADPGFCDYAFGRRCGRNCAVTGGGRHT